MEISERMLESQPEITREERDILYRWGDDIWVIVFDDGMIGQFYTAFRVKRPELENAIRAYLEANEAMFRQVQQEPLFLR